MFVQLFVFSTCRFTHTASTANTPTITASTKIVLIVQRRLWGARAEDSMLVHHVTSRPRNTAGRRCRLRNVRKVSAIVALLLAGLLLAGCGESSQEKAKAQVCSARSDIQKQVKTLGELTLSTSVLSQAKEGLDAIGSDLKKIKEAQPNLEPARRQQIETATHTLEGQVSSIVTGFVSNPSLSNVEKQLKTSLTQYAKSFEQALAPINCS